MKLAFLLRYSTSQYPAKYPLGATMFALSYVIYYLTNHFPVRPPVMLPMTWIDTAAPFLPNSIFIYISEYIYFAFVYILLKNKAVIQRYLASFFTLQVVSCFIFIIYPTTYPRELFPVPSDVAPWVASVWDWLRTQDSPNNCFPSLHVSSVYLSSLVFLDEGKRKHFWIFFVWGTLIALSTLTTKQHYVADIIAGLGFGWVHYVIFHLRSVRMASARVHTFAP
jgi:membrane-associated phospholipid phosphatase